jgi:hypothetical protein
MKIIERTFDAQTGETVDVERELTKDEIADRAESEARIQAIIYAEAEKAATKSALLERLGITAEEAALLLS